MPLERAEDSPYSQKDARKFALPGGRHPNDVRALARTPDGLVWAGTDEDDGTYFLLPYWMGKYYGYIE